MAAPESVQPPELPPLWPQPTRPAPGTWVRVSAGSFVMGTSPGDSCRRTENESRHRVVLTHDFELAATEVTQRQYQQILSENPAYYKDCGEDCPMELLDWHHAAAYCNALSEYAGLPSCYSCDGTGPALRCRVTAAAQGNALYRCPGYRLPTEAEWEYAYRAGTDTATYLGDLTTCSELDPKMDDIAWFLRNGQGHTHKVAQKKPNPLGLFDMSGNVWEWTSDPYVTSLKDDTDPVGVATDALRTLRGGSFNCLPSESRASHRMALTDTTSGLNVGFRCARSLR